MSKRVKRTGDKGGGGRKKQRGDGGADADGEDAGFFLLDDDDKQQKAAEGSSEDEEAQETAEEKRLRLARAYIDQVRAAAAASDGEGGSEDDEERRGVTGGRDRLGERLQQDAAEAAGRLHRNLAHRVTVPDQRAAAEGSSEEGSDEDDEDSSASESEEEETAAGTRIRRGGAAAVMTAAERLAAYGAGQFAPAHDLAATALALAHDGAAAFTVSKDGTIFKWDVETMQKQQLLRPGDSTVPELEPEAADWVRRRGSSKGGLRALYAAALSTDGRFLAVGGGDRKVHVFDAVQGRHVAAYPGHRDTVSGLVFREGTHTLYSSSYDRTVKIWSIDDGAYVDTLFGHQAEVYAVDSLRQERVVTCGHDHTCRVWKVQEESHLIFRGNNPAMECCRYITGTEWLSGANDGSLQVWTQLKKKPVSVYKGAHACRTTAKPTAAGGAPAPPARGSWATANSEAVGWVQSVAVARGSDLAASGAGDGAVRLWAVEQSKHGGAGPLRPLGELPALGFVNGLAIERRGRFVAAAVGPEPRLGRWGRIEGARSGLLVHRLEVAEENE